MNNYKIKIEGMHCNSCVLLLTMELEEAGMDQVVININTREAVFSSHKTKNEIQKILDTVFDQLERYSYSLLECSNS